MHDALCEGLINMNRRSVVLSFLILFTSAALVAQSGARTLTIHLRGVAGSDFSILPQSGPHAFKVIALQKGIERGGTAKITIPEDYLPGQFVLRSDYRENSKSDPYPSEKQVIIGEENVEIWLHPMHVHHPDSTWYSRDEKENRTYEAFLAENQKRKETLLVLQDFLLKYPHHRSPVFRKAGKEFSRLRKAHTAWLNERRKKDAVLFCSRIYAFERVPDVDFAQPESSRKAEYREHYLEGVDFSDPLIIRTAEMRKWMDTYVNLHGELVRSEDQVDSVFTAAGRKAIEAAKPGNPLVYGWMVDYFYQGYERFGLSGGMTMLGAYLEDPNCMTEKRRAIEKRLRGLASMVPGTPAPDFSITDSTGNVRQFSGEGSTEFKLVLFWSASCGHCLETVSSLYPYSMREDIRNRMTVYAVSVDESEEEIAKWNTEKALRSGWIHHREEGGVNSELANAYSILSTPTFFLVRSSDGTLAAVPKSVEDLRKFLETN